jgi:hypothetical protein
MHFPNLQDAAKSGNGGGKSHLTVAAPLSSIWLML